MAGGLTLDYGQYLVGGRGLPGVSPYFHMHGDNFGGNFQVAFRSRRESRLGKCGMRRSVP